MHNTSFQLAAAAATAALLAAAPLTTTAQSLDPAPIELLLSPAGGALTGSFTQGVSGLFVDTFSFLPLTLSGAVTVSLTSTGPLTFFSALLGSDAYVAPDDASAWSFSGVATPSEPLSLTLFGFAGDLQDLAASPASYTATISVADGGAVPAIPEPSTYALMLAGLAMASFVVARQRRRVERER